MDKSDLSESLKKLDKIVDWFESQKSVDIEKGLEKVKEAMVLIKNSKEKFKNIENEFEEIKKEFNNIDNGN